MKQKYSKKIEELQILFRKMKEDKKFFNNFVNNLLNNLFIFEFVDYSIHYDTENKKKRIVYYDFVLYYKKTLYTKIIDYECNSIKNNVKKKLNSLKNMLNIDYVTNSMSFNNKGGKFLITVRTNILNYKIFYDTIYSLFIDEIKNILKKYLKDNIKILIVENDKIK